MRVAVLLLALALTGCSAIRLGGPLGEPSEAPPDLPLDVLWERDADGAFGPAAPWVTEAYVMVGTRKGEVVILDRESGRVVGSEEFGESVEGRLAVSAGGETIYVPTSGRNGGVEAFDVRQGERVWRWPEGQVQGGVARIDDTVVVPLLEGRLVGLDARTGALRWEQASPQGVQFHAEPLALGSDLVVADDHGVVRRVRALDGEEQWRAQVAGPVYAAPTADADGVYLSTTRGHLVRLNAATGAHEWTVDAQEALRVSAVAVGGPGLAVGWSDGTVRGIDPTTGAERWRMVTDGNVTAQPIWIGDRVVVGTLDKRLVIIDGTTGRVEWSTELRGRVKSALAVGGGLLVVLVEPRHVIAFHTAP